jgi:uroporphyrinogen decarboxylase
LFYVEPHDAAGVTYPQTWGFDAPPAVPGPEFFPPWHWDTLDYVRSHAPTVSVHGEVFSPFTQVMELVGLSEGMLALALDPRRVQAMLERLVEGTVLLAIGHFEHGADAVLISSAYAGAGFISKKQYEQFVLPCERAVIERVKARVPAMPVYTHTCGAIADRLELMEATGTDGIDTLDPPPLGTIDLADAKARIGSRLFIKGNMDPVNTILRGTAGECYRDACARIATASPGGGYILSSACSVPPHAPPENIVSLVRAAADAVSTF